MAGQRAADDGGAAMKIGLQETLFEGGLGTLEVGPREKKGRHKRQKEGGGGGEGGAVD